MDNGNPSISNVGATPGPELSVNTVRDIINESMSEFAKTFSASMTQSYISIEDLINSKVDGVREEFNLSIADFPPHPPVQQSHSQGRSETSHPDPRIVYGKTGANGGETEGAG